METFFCWLYCLPFVLHDALVLVILSNVKGTTDLQRDSRRAFPLACHGENVEQRVVAIWGGATTVYRAHPTNQEKSTAGRTVSAVVANRRACSRCVSSTCRVPRRDLRRDHVSPAQCTLSLCANKQAFSLWPFRMRTRNGDHPSHPMPPSKQAANFSEPPQTKKNLRTSNTPPPLAHTKQILKYLPD